MAARPHRDHRQTGIERRRQVVGIGVVGEHIDGVVARILRHRRRVIYCVTGASLTLLMVRLTVAVLVWPGIAGAVVTDGVGEAVRTVVVGIRRIAHAAAREAHLPWLAVLTAMTVRPALNGGVRLSASVSLASTSMALLLVSSPPSRCRPLPPAHR